MSEETPETKNTSSFTNERLNFILALCAILISAASFYATYIQANASKQQVKAMTYPLIQFDHSNFDSKNKLNKVSFELNNAGVGPAIIKSIEFSYEDKNYATLNDLLRACCLEPLKAHTLLKQERAQKQLSAGESIITNTIENRILSMNESLVFLSLVEDEINQPVWKVLSDLRWQVKPKICYCSLLENCYTTKQTGIVSEIKSCS